MICLAMLWTRNKSWLAGSSYRKLVLVDMQCVEGGPQWKIVVTRR
jgi:hypothetical protein